MYSWAFLCGIWFSKGDFLVFPDVFSFYFLFVFFFFPPYLCLIILLLYVYFFRNLHFPVFYILNFSFWIFLHRISVCFCFVSQTFPLFYHLRLFFINSFLTFCFPSRLDFLISRFSILSFFPSSPFVKRRQIHRDQWWEERKTEKEADLWAWRMN